MTTPAEKRKIQKALQFLEVLRGLDAEMPIGAAASLLMIAKGETPDGGGLSIVELEAEGGFSRSTSSRYTQLLGERDRNHAEGYKLVSSQPDLMNRRKKVLRLTDAGHRVVNMLTSLVAQ